MSFPYSSKLNKECTYYIFWYLSSQLWVNLSATGASGADQNSAEILTNEYHTFINIWSHNNDPWLLLKESWGEHLYLLSLTWIKKHCRYWTSQCHPKLSWSNGEWVSLTLSKSSKSFNLAVLRLESCIFVPYRRDDHGNLLFLIYIA